MANINFASVDAQCFGRPNPGGISRVFISSSRNFSAQWPMINQMDDSLNITVTPPMIAGAKWAEYLFPHNTATASSDSSGESSFQSYKHTAEFMMAGYDATVRAELKKMINTGLIIIMEMQDGTFVVIGNTKNPIFLKNSFGLGKKGSDKRGNTLKGDIDGMMSELPVLPDALVASLAILPLAA
jgi:hypothetical protein